MKKEIWRKPIKYPPIWKRKSFRLDNEDCEKWVRYSIYSGKKVDQSVLSEEWINGYKYAIRDIKRLNKK